MSRIPGLELKQKKRKHPGERRVLKGPQRLGQCGQAERETGRTFVLQISSVRASHSRRRLLQAGQAMGGREVEPANKGGLSVSLRPHFVKGAFTSFLKDGSIPRPLCGRWGGSGPRLPDSGRWGGPGPRLPDSLDPLAFWLCLWSSQEQVSRGRTCVLRQSQTSSVGCCGLSGWP